MQGASDWLDKHAHEPVRVGCTDTSGPGSRTDRTIEGKILNAIYKNPATISSEQLRGDTEDCAEIVQSLEAVQDTLFHM